MAQTQLVIEEAAALGLTSVPARDLLHGHVDVTEFVEGWVRPERFTEAQARACTSVLAWHPGLFRQMMRCTSGITVEFTTDASFIELEARVDEIGQGAMVVVQAVLAVDRNTRRPFDGISADVDGTHIPPALPDANGVVRVELGDAAKGGSHHVRLWLPAITGCSIRNVRGNGSFISPVEKRELLLVIGDSIAQGFYAGDAALSWPAQLGELLGCDVLNQGIGGQVFQPGSLADLGTFAQPSRIIVELGENYRFEPCGETAVSRDIRAVFSEIAELWPDAPVWAITPMFSVEGLRLTHQRSCFSQVAALIAKHVGARPNMQTVDGLWLMDGSIELLADHSDHPTAEGMSQIARRMAITMRGEDVRATLAQSAKDILADAPMSAFPLAECLRRGIGEVLFSERGCTFMRFTPDNQCIYAEDRKLARRVMREMCEPTMLMVCGENIVRDAERVMGFTTAMPCHLVVYEQGEPLPVDAERDIRPLDASFKAKFLEHYSHTEYLADGELDRIIEKGLLLGAFEDGELVGFIGEHEEGSIGMLEVFPGHRREGWAEALFSAKINEHIEQGFIPWAQIWPGNVASLRMSEKLGCTIYPARDMTFMGGFDR